MKTTNVLPIIEKIETNLITLPSHETRLGFAEAFDLLNQETIKIDDVKKMNHFSSLFGRGQCYLSFIRQKIDKS